MLSAPGREHTGNPLRATSCADDHLPNTRFSRFKFRKRCFLFYGTFLLVTSILARFIQSGIPFRRPESRAAVPKGLAMLAAMLAREQKKEVKTRSTEFEPTDC